MSGTRWKVHQCPVCGLDIIPAATNDWYSGDMGATVYHRNHWDATHSETWQEHQANLDRLHSEMILATTRAGAWRGRR
jgi:hypothetical protein